MASYKSTTTKCTLADAVSTGYSMLQELRDEVREIVDNASEGLSETARIQTLSETADTLDEYADDDPNVPDFCAGKEITITLQVPVRRDYAPSRTVRCENACAHIEAARDSVQEIIDRYDTETLTEKENEEVDALNELLDALDNAADTVSGVEFPGMFG